MEPLLVPGVGTCPLEPERSLPVSDDPPLSLLPRSPDAPVVSEPELDDPSDPMEAEPLLSLKNNGRRISAILEVVRDSEMSTVKPDNVSSTKILSTNNVSVPSFDIFRTRVSS